MNKLTVAAALIGIGAMLAPAQADILNGGPKQVGNQCFKFAQAQERDARFGSWGACPQAASTAAPTQRRARRSSSR